MDFTQVDPEVYGRLLAEARPGIIEDGQEHERLLRIAESLMEKGEAMAVEEEKLLALLVLLIEAYETSVEREEDEEEPEGASPHPPPAPYETLKRLMDARDLQVTDIADIFGNPGNARAVLEGKRGISRGEAKQLGRFFQVPPKLFQS